MCELLTRCKPFICRLIEYCSPLCAGAPASNFSRLHAVETKAFRIIGISRGEAVFGCLGVSLWVSRCLSLSLWSFCILPSPLRPCPSALPVIYPSHISVGCSRSASHPLLVKLPKSRITAHLHSFILLFFPSFGTNSHTLFNPTPPSMPSKQLFTTISYLPPSKTMIFFTSVNPPQIHLPQIPCFPS